MESKAGPGPPQVPILSAGVASLPRKTGSGEQAGVGSDASGACRRRGGRSVPQNFLQPNAGPPRGHRQSQTKGKGEETWHKGTGLQQLVWLLPCQPKFDEKKFGFALHLVKRQNKESFSLSNKHRPAVAPWALVIFQPWGAPQSSPQPLSPKRGSCVGVGEGRGGLLELVLAAAAAHLGTQSTEARWGGPLQRPASPRQRAHLDCSPSPCPPAEEVGGLRGPLVSAVSPSGRQDKCPLLSAIPEWKGQVSGTGNWVLPGPAAFSSSGPWSQPGLQLLFLLHLLAWLLEAQACSSPSLNWGLRPGQPTSLHPSPAHPRAGEPMAGLEP